MHITDNDNTQAIIENWEHPISLFEEDNLYKLLEVVALENNRIDLDIEEVYDDKFLSSATGEELEKIGDLVGVNRKTAEGDEKLRKRIQGEFAAQASDTTHEVFASAMLSILGTNKNAVTVNTPPDTVPKVVEVEVDGSIISDNPLTKTELAKLLDKTVSADAKVNIVTTGTFAFAGDDSALEGWNEGTWSSIVEK